MSNIKEFVVTEAYLESNCALGESPFYDEVLDQLRFVDIVKQKLHFIDLKKGPSSHTAQDLEFSIGTTSDIEGDDEHFVFGGKHGYGKYNRKTGEVTMIRKYWEGDHDQKEEEKKYRGNDGAVDARGRYWVTVMRDPLVNEPTDDGVVFRLDPDLSLHRMIEGVSIPNGISWTTDNKTMYFADSPTKNIFKYDYNIETGSISNRRVFYHVEDEAGVPDGHTQDEHGNVWTAVHGLGKVLCISPEGKVVAEVRLPTRCPTCPRFVGESLFISSAEEEEPDKYPESTKLQGSLFKVQVGVKGQSLHKFKLQA